MNNVVLKCMQCGGIFVIATKDLWKLSKCSTCESKNLINLDEEFGQIEAIEEDK